RPPRLPLGYVAQAAGDVPLSANDVAASLDVREACSRQQGCDGASLILADLHYQPTLRMERDRRSGDDPPDRSEPVSSAVERFARLVTRDFRREGRRHDITSIQSADEPSV